MHKISKDARIPDVNTVCNILTKNNERMGICIDYDKLLEYYSYAVIMSRDKRPRLQKYLGLSTSDVMTDDVFLSALLKLGVSTGLGRTGSGSVSVSTESLQSAIDTGLYSTELVAIMKAKIELNKWEYAVSHLYAFTRYDPVNIPAFDGHRMIVTRPTWAPQNTGRFAMQNPPIQNISKDFADILTVPEGWRLYYCDSSQIEPRIIYSAFIPDKQIQALINLYNDAYFGLLHYVTMPIEDIVSGRTDFVKREVTDEMRDMRQALKRLGNGVMYGKASNPNNDPLTANYIQRIGGHPIRVKWQKRMEDLVDAGQDIFPTYFGTPINIKVGGGREKYLGNPEALRRHDIRCAINNPIQGTAGDLARYSVVNVDHFLTRNCPNSVILDYVHDSSMFAIYEDEYDKAISYLKDAVAYDVEGWLPIYSEGEEGRHSPLFADII